MGEAPPQKPGSTHVFLLSDQSNSFMSGSWLCWVGQVPFDLVAFAGGRALPCQFDPIQTQVPRRLWLSCVGESGSRCEDDLGVERRGFEAGQVP